MICTKAPSLILMMCTHVQKDFPPGHWGSPSAPFGHKMSSCTSALCERSGEGGGGTREMLLTVLLSNWRKGLAVDRKSNLERQRAEMKVE